MFKQYDHEYQKLNIKCECGGDLMCNTKLLLLSLPPMYHVYCKKCDAKMHVKSEDLPMYLNNKKGWG